MGLTACRMGYVVGKCPHMHLLLEMEYTTKWCLLTCMQLCRRQLCAGQGVGCVTVTFTVGGLRGSMQ